MISPKKKHAVLSFATQITVCYQSGRNGNCFMWQSWSRPYCFLKACALSRKCCSDMLFSALANQATAPAKFLHVLAAIFLHAEAGDPGTFQTAALRAVILDRKLGIFAPWWQHLWTASRSGEILRPLYCKGCFSHLHSIVSYSRRLLTYSWMWFSSASEALICGICC